MLPSRQRWRTHRRMLQQRRQLLGRLLPREVSSIPAIHHALAEDVTDPETDLISSTFDVTVRVYRGLCY
jgi:hypothetical protein